MTTVFMKRANLTVKLSLPFVGNRLFISGIASKKLCQITSKSIQCLSVNTKETERGTYKFKYITTSKKNRGLKLYYVTYETIVITY